MSEKPIHAVTGAFGYSGKYITRRLLGEGRRVITLTNSLHRPNEFGDKVRAYPFNFDYPSDLVENLRGVSVLYNTYWVRFNHRSFKHSEAVENTKTLFNSAKEAGVGRIVHVSITNPSEESHLEYFHGKAVLEKALQDTGLPHTILRPTVIFGKEDILINNIAWLLRRSPIFGVFGTGNYGLQPIFAEDLADLAVEAGARDGNQIINAIGPETFTYRELVKAIATALGRKRLVVSIPPKLGLFLGQILGKLMNDVLITPEEIDGLMSDLLYVESAPTGKTKLTVWAKDNATSLGQYYASELGRRRK